MSTRVVIAEDEAIVRLDLREILEEEGFDVVGETGRGDEALRLIRELEPELAVLDIKMPGLDGLSVVREIAPEWRTAVLMLTAFSQRSAIEEAREAGAVAYLIKPFQRTELVPAIHVALARFAEEKALKEQTTDEDEQVATRRTVDHAKAKLMDHHGLSEADAISFLHRNTVEGDVAAAATRILEGTINPE